MTGTVPRGQSGCRGRLFSTRDMYDIERTEGLFVAAVREKCAFHYRNCPEYRRILDYTGFRPESIEGMGDIAGIPFLPTLFFKRHAVFSMPEDKIRTKVLSSGTSGMSSCIGYDAGAMACGVYMGLKVAARSRLVSARPANYIILGYRPHRDNPTGVTRTMFLSTFFSPALRRTYALEWKDGQYYPDMDGVVREMIRCSRSSFPVRILGFPSYTWFALKLLEQKGIRLSFPKGSRIVLSGGWKQHGAEEVDKKVLYRLAGQVLGIGEEDIVEFFSAVEHPVLYCTCKNHHFHVPVYSRVIIRDVDTLKPLGYGKQGLVNLVTPMMKATPILSVMTDDMGVLHEGTGCGCGIAAPYLELKGRAGIREIRTCAAGAEEFLRGQEWMF